MFNKKVAGWSGYVGMRRTCIGRHLAAGCPARIIMEGYSTVLRKIL
jgi:hypothetical protein